MKRLSVVRTVLSGLVFVLALAGCGGAEQTAEQPAGSPAATPTAAAEGAESTAIEPSTPADGTGPADGEEVDPSSTAAFTLAFPDVPDTSDVAVLAAIDDMKERGYNAETVILSDPELGTEGLARNEFQFMVGGGVAPILAISQGAPIRMIGERAGSEWLMMSVGDITECEDLDGARVGIHSESGTTTAMVRSYIQENCPEISPQYLVIPGSPNRVQAMIAGELDASPATIGDIVNLEASGELDPNILANFIETIPKFRNALFYGNTDFMSANEDVTVELLRSQLEQHRRINEDPAYLTDLMTRYLEDIDPDVAQRIAQQYVDLEIFANDGGLDLSDIEWSLEFFEEYEFTPEVYAVEDVVDTSYLEQAREEIGPVS